MLTGDPPFKDSNPYLIYKKVLECHVDYNSLIDPAAWDLISRLLVKDPFQRITEEGIKSHEFFQGINWDQCDRGRLIPLMVPDISGPADTTYYDNYSESPDDSPRKHMQDISLEF